MLISLNWIRDFIDLPADLDPRALAEKFTRTTAEVDGVHEINVGAVGLIAAKVESATPVQGSSNLRLVTLNIGQGKTVETISAAPVIHVGQHVVYAPVGAKVSAYGTIKAATVAGRNSSGMILPGEAIGIELASQEAIFLGEEIETGAELPTDLFNDWVIEIDNKSITHRPDLWGHYGIAREIAAILRLPLKLYPLDSMDHYKLGGLPDVPITIADAKGCRRYSGMVVTDVPSRPAPLWMQLRLGHVGLRPITALVDLTNYIMLDLGQPMHAFDADKVDRIEVARAKEGEKFRTLDGFERTLMANDLMIQCGGKSIALAGVMGGENTEVSTGTTKLLLESANFDPATIRKTASRLGLRTDASARFEKSLDPNHTVMSIQRFLTLAQPLWPKMKPLSKLSDAYPRPLEPVTVKVSLPHVSRALGREMSKDETTRTLTPLGFKVSGNDTELSIDVPSYRGTGDVSIEVDIVEELARCIGFDTIAPAMPRVSVRRVDVNPIHELEQKTLHYFSTVRNFNEIHGYIWYDERWLKQIGFSAGTCFELKNPAAEGCQYLRQTLMPGMLAAAVKNRFYFPAFSLIEVGSVFDPNANGDKETRHAGLIMAKRARKADDELADSLKQAITGWAANRFNQQVRFVPPTKTNETPWADGGRTSAISIANRIVGQIGIAPLALRRAMDEHLSAWSIAWAEITLTDLVNVPARVSRLGTIPAYPLVDLDVSLLIQKSTRYAEVAQRLSEFRHPLLRNVHYLGHYEGGSIAANQRSLTFRAVLGDDTRTLTEKDASEFRTTFETYVKQSGYQIRQ